MAGWSVRPGVLEGTALDQRDEPSDAFGLPMCAMPAVCGDSDQHHRTRTVSKVDREKFTAPVASEDGHPGECLDGPGLSEDGVRFKRFAGCVKPYVGIRRGPAAAKPG